MGKLLTEVASKSSFPTRTPAMTETSGKVVETMTGIREDEFLMEDSVEQISG